MRQLPVPDPGTPDSRSALRYLLWLVRLQRRNILAGMAMGIIWMLSQALMPAAVGAAIDAGVVHRSSSALLAWAGVLLGLDEATSLIDPSAARHLERSLAAVLEGRTVIAIAHRLFSAHDADRVAVVEHGRITELGPHADLIAADGAYAALWRSWHGDRPANLTSA